MQAGQRAIRANFEDCPPAAVRAARARGAIEEAIAALDEPTDGRSPVGEAERDDRGKRPVGRKAEDGAEIARAAEVGGPVKNTIGSLHQRCLWVRAICLIE